MSATNRIISGSIASWAQIGITIAAQVALVPLYLSFWSAQTYGIWLSVQALIVILSTLDRGHQNYLGFEFLKLGKDNCSQLTLNLWSGAGMGIIIGIMQVLFVVVLFKTGLLRTFLDKASITDATTLDAAGIVLLLQVIAWLISGSLGGIFVRALAVFGYYPRMAWWGVFAAVVTNLAPALSVTFGAGLLTTGIVAACATIGYNVPLYIDLFRLMRKEGIGFHSASVRLGWENFLRSLNLSGKDLLENFRQQGVRLLLAPLAGSVGLVAFSTMRTGANVALQGLNTVTNPMMPELMRFLTQRDQARSEAAFGTVWVVLVALMAPAVVVLQAVVEPLFVAWTQGKVRFEPPLFAALSLSVLVYALAQPAMAVVTGNNLLRTQIILSALVAAIVVGSVSFLVSRLGIAGAGFALLVAEITALIGYRLAAQRWLTQHSMVWPNRSFLIAAASVAIAGVAMGALVLQPSVKWLILFLALPLLAWNARRYWLALPGFATQQASRLLAKLPGGQRVVSFPSFFTKS